MNIRLALKRRVSSVCVGEGVFKMLSIFRLYEVGRQDDKRIMNWKGFGRKTSNPDRHVIPAIDWKDRRKEDFSPYILKSLNSICQSKVKLSL
jgi:hypothetical protein